MRKNVLLFALAVLVQVFIVAAVPARQLYTRLTGTIITIKTAPYDPYDFLTGYHVVLNYEISGLNDPNLQIVRYQEEVTVYAILQKGPEGVWFRSAVVNQPPNDLPEGTLFLKGVIRGNRILYGIEHYYIPEAHREAIEQSLRANPENSLVRVRVDRFGNAALIGLTINGSDYDY